MKHHKMCALIFLFLVSACASQKPAQETTLTPALMQNESVTAPFVLGAGDELTINVWRQEDLKRNVIIDPSGYIHYPLIGELRAAGLTIPELRKQMTTSLAKYIVDPQVDVGIAELKSQEIFVLGEVKEPGSFMLNRQTSALQAIVKAGGFTHDANTFDVLLMRNDKDLVKVSAISLDIGDVQKAPSSYRNVSLRNGDILYVPPTKIASFERFMSRLNTILLTVTNFERSIVLGADAYDAVMGNRRTAVLAN